MRVSNTLPTILAALAMLAVSVSVTAADSDSRYVIWGAGEASCNRYNEARAANDFQRFKDYTMGYLTAYNTYVPETYSITRDMDSDAIIAWLDDFCRTHQIEGFAGALHQFVEEMKETRAQHAPTSGGRWP